jgi:hypothetical protein
MIIAKFLKRNDATMQRILLVQKVHSNVDLRIFCSCIYIFICLHMIIYVNVRIHVRIYTRVQTTGFIHICMHVYITLVLYIM